MDISKKEILEADTRGRLEKRREEINYARFREDFRKIPRGTVVLKNRIILGFPHIERVFSLVKGIERNIKSDEIYIEEKIDGYNLRVALIDKKIFAFSRGGFVDAFSTEKARELKLDKFFSDYPGYILCGEMIGNTPFTKPTKKFDVKFLVFDIDQGNGNFVPCDERYVLLRKYKIESVPVLGRFKTSEKKKLENLALEINRNKLEGMVIKSTDRACTVKYVTPNSDIDDIRHSILFDMPSGFFLQRVFRSGLFIHDFNLNKEEYYKKMGQAFYESVWEDLENVKSERGAEQVFEILVKDKNIWENLHKHMSREVKLEVIFKREEKAGSRIRFRKKYKKTTRKLRDAMSGKGETD